MYPAKKNGNNDRFITFSESETIAENINYQNEIKKKYEIEERPGTFDRELDWFIGDYDCITTCVVSLAVKPIDYESCLWLLYSKQIFLWGWNKWKK